MEWREYGGDSRGQRFSPLTDVTRDNVQCLEPAWTYRTGDLPRSGSSQYLASEVTPILVDGTLYLCTPHNRVIALDPETGAERWSYDPGIDLGGRYANQLVCRGVSAWRDPARTPGETCARRIFTATNDARLVALDAADGRPCTGFGDGGTVDLNPATGRQAWRGEYQVTSPPAVADEVVIVGSAISDNQRTDAPSGVVRAFDARGGAQRWAWDLRPPGFVAAPENTSAAGHALATPNVWAPIAVDRERDLVFVPTGNPSPDYYRGDSQLDYYGSSVVALTASTGQVRWRFQTVHHDLWDYDVPAQPTLFELARGDERIPALVQATKMGLLFVLHRETGEPLFEVEERPVPQGPVPGERLSPTQPFPSRPPPLVRQALSPEQAFGFTPWDRGACRRRLAPMRSEGIYTPPSREGTLAAVDLVRGEIVWQVPFGTLRDFLPVVPIPIRVGLPNVGGPLVTASGLVFIAAAFDRYLRAFDLETGEELWRAGLPFGGQATPMTYRAREGGRQYIVIAATGYGRFDRSPVGDAIVAFALPQGP